MKAGRHLAEAAIIATNVSQLSDLHPKVSVISDSVSRSLVRMHRTITLHARFSILGLTNRIFASGQFHREFWHSFEFTSDNLTRGPGNVRGFRSGFEGCLH